MTDISAVRRLLPFRAMRRLCAVVVVSSLAAACGSSSSSSASPTGPNPVRLGGSQGDLLGIADPHDGSRLRLEKLTLEDGTVDVIGIWDAQLETRCTFQHGDDDVWRCVPTEYTEQSTFLDKNCSKRVAVVDDNCLVALLYRDEQGALHRPAGPLQQGRTTYSARLCGEEEPHEKTFDIGEPIPASSFVTGGLVIVGDGRIRALMLDGDDGSRTMVGYHDAQLDTDCTFYKAADRAFCVPPSGAHTDLLFRDASCTEEVGVAVPNPPLQDGIGTYTVHVGGCNAVEVHRVGASLGVLYEGGPRGSYCDPAGSSANELGPDIASELYSVALPVVDRRGRLARTLIGGSVAWYDTKRSETCVFDLASDGTMRCLPPGVVLEKRGFETNDCSGPENLASPDLDVPLPSCDPPVHFGSTIKPLPPSCGAKRPVFAIDGSRDGHLVSNRADDGSCSVPSVPISERVLAVREIAATDFASATASKD
jgi:hypothetical protein